MNKKLTYLSKDNRFSVELADKIVQKLVEYIIPAKKKETGGILLGKYNSDLTCAIITTITGPPTDSKSGRFWFFRGIKNLQEKINLHWKEKKYYLGEWHFHPYASADPSFIDIKQMKEISINKNYNCPEPILLIIGGNPQSFEIRIFVITKNCRPIQLLPRP